MQRYLNLGGNSDIRYYEIGNDFVKVQFSNGDIYTYTYESAGISTIERMKELAEEGEGLLSYIMHYARGKSASKQRN